jgi:Tol biopolymer transport system component
MWFNRNGEALEPVGPPGDYADFRLSPDGKYLAASLVEAKTANIDIWLDDLTRHVRSRFTVGSALNATSIWSPDGTRLLFRSNTKGVVELLQKSSSGGGSEEVVFGGGEERERGVQTNNLFPSDWSPHGNSLLFSVPTVASGSYDLWLLPLVGDKRPVSLVSSQGDQIHGSFSPDGRLVAYSSNESGQFEVIVQNFPGLENKIQVSTNGGYEPRWKADGRELYYLSNDRKLMAVSVRPGPSFDAAKLLFQTRVPVLVSSFRTHYDASSDGSRFLVNTQSEDPLPVPITIVLNWTAGLKK